jgi:sec-independent protein translocase protein TatA
MGFMSWGHWLVVILLVVLLFGSGKISTLMGDVAKGIKSFRRGMAEDQPQAQPAAVEAQPATASAAQASAPQRAS